MKNLAVIPARSGSKGLTDKNIRLFAGKPLIYYSIRAALAANVFAEVMVSTDSDEYARIAQSHGASVPFLRSDKNASDTATSWDVVREVLKMYQKSGKEFDSVTLLQPTSPLRTSEDIIQGFRILEETKGNAVVSVCEADHSPLWCGVLSENFSMKGFIPKTILNLPRQHLPKHYRINGAVYIVKCSALYSHISLYDNSCYALIMDKRNSVDIDDELDFIIAETIFNIRNNSGIVN